MVRGAAARRERGEGRGSPRGTASRGRAGGEGLRGVMGGTIQRGVDRVVGGAVGGTPDRHCRTEMNESA